MSKSRLNAARSSVPFRARFSTWTAASRSCSSTRWRRNGRSGAGQAGEYRARTKRARVRWCERGLWRCRWDAWAWSGERQSGLGQSCAGSGTMNSRGAKCAVAAIAALALAGCDGYARVYGVVRRVPCGGGSPVPIAGAKVAVLQEGRIQRGSTGTDEQGAFDRFLLTGSWPRKVRVELTIEKAGCTPKVIAADAL